MATYYQKINSDWKKMKLRGIQGNLVKVAVLDSGNNNAAANYHVNFTSDGQADVLGHGSLVASVIKSEIGLANGVILYDVKVVNDAGSIFEQSVLDGLQYAIDNGAHIVTMSFTVSKSTALQNKINECYAAGIVLISSCGNSPTLGNILFPAGAQNVIAVNSLNEAGVAGHKSVIQGSLDHGVDICCNGVQSECIDKNGNVVQSSGTSLSDVWLAGALALEIELSGYKEPQRVMNYILARAEKQPDTQLYGRGRFIF